MRINKFIAQATGLSRRAADVLVERGKVLVNGEAPSNGQNVGPGDSIRCNGRTYRYDDVQAGGRSFTIMLNKPPGYVVSRDGQGNRTIYELLPPIHHRLKPVGRLDKYSSGLLLLTDDGDLANQLTHPRYQKTKIYEIRLDKALQPLHRQMVNDHGISLDDGVSRLTLERMKDGDDLQWRVTMHEGRNRQIRRTFEALGYEVIRLHRTHFGSYSLGDLKQAQFKSI